MSHRDEAEGLLSLIEINEDTTTDPHVIAAMAQIHAILALVDAVQSR
jgi:hypothetical protein